MKTILVTGATGFIGSNLTKKLIESGYTVRILRRENSPLTNLENVDVEHRIGDVRNFASLRDAMRGCDTVFHTAAIVSFWKPKHKEMFEVNVNGTRNIVEASLSEKVQRLVHTSSIAAIGRPVRDGELADETTPYNWSNFGNGYKYSKHLAEKEIYHGIEKGLNAVIVNPAVVIGPGDIHFNGGSIIKSVKKGFVPFYINGGLNICYVDDVVNGHITAALKGKTGERYILGGTNLTHKEAFHVTAKIVGGLPPLLPLPVVAVRAIAKIFDGIGFLIKKEPLLTSELISGAGLKNWYSSAKAEKELDYKVTTFEEAVRKTYEWYKGSNLL
ncbi:MAG: SDR family oxidoreductase [Bacteroidota bacterium]|nr:SDR family oxidoreductase [Bacteroidota bacterium]